MCFKRACTEAVTDVRGVTTWGPSARQTADWGTREGFSQTTRGQRASVPRPIHAVAHFIIAVGSGAASPASSLTHTTWCQVKKNASPFASSVRRAGPDTVVIGGTDTVKWFYSSSQTMWGDEEYVVDSKEKFFARKKLMTPPLRAFTVYLF